MFEKVQILFQWFCLIVVSGFATAYQAIINKRHAMHTEVMTFKNYSYEVGT